jgi:thymidylate synthase
MAQIIITNNCLTAWRDACNHMLVTGDGFNLFMEIEEPLNFNQGQLNEIIANGILNNSALQDVINTIFPYKLFNKRAYNPIEGFYALHEAIYNRGRSFRVRNRSRWGTYFLRFTRFGRNSFNQLQNIIEAINRRNNNHLACFNMHVTSVELDSNIRKLGGPCLQYIQLSQENGIINLTAVYRNHDFYEKALGNYIGLARLLEFICNQTNHDMGIITCHSIHYYLPHRRIINNCIQNLTW